MTAAEPATTCGASGGFGTVDDVGAFDTVVVVVDAMDVAVTVADFGRPGVRIGIVVDAD